MDFMKVGALIKCFGMCLLIGNIYNKSTDYYTENPFIHKNDLH